MIRKARKKPVVIETVQWDGTISTLEELIAFGAPVFLPANSPERSLIVGTLEDGGDQVKHYATVGDWIIKGVKGEFYPCKPDIFDTTYDLEPNN